MGAARACVAAEVVVVEGAGLTANIRASVKRYPRAILSTPGTSGYYISYNRVLRAVLQKPLRCGIF